MFRIRGSDGTITFFSWWPWPLLDLDVTGLDLTRSWLDLTLNCLDLDLTWPWPDQTWLDMALIDDLVTLLEPQPLYCLYVIIALSLSMLPFWQLQCSTYTVIRMGTFLLTVTGDCSCLVLTCYLTHGIKIDHMTMVCLNNYNFDPSLL